MKQNRSKELAKLKEMRESHLKRMETRTLSPTERAMLATIERAIVQIEAGK